MSFNAALSATKESSFAEPLRRFSRKPKPKTVADVCLILEGTYPYTIGGVASWTHELIRMQEHLNFTIVALISADAPAQLKYELPDNVVGLTTIRLQCLPDGLTHLRHEDEQQIFSTLETALPRLQEHADLGDLKKIMAAFAPHRTKLGSRILLDSKGAWDLLRRMYSASLQNVSFLDYFWSWRGLFGGLFSVLLADLPPARVYHALCTGYAGLMLARAHLETGQPCLVTEHGIYTNERRIEIASADWIDNPNISNLAVHTEVRELRDFWIDTFLSYSRFCYQASSSIVTLYEGNYEFQLMDGADRQKLRVIPNGIDVDRFSTLTPKDHPPTVALIGRVVPIKDIKTYIKAVRSLKQLMPEVRAFMLGPNDEDPEYAKECQELMDYFKLDETLRFTGKANIDDYLGEIDVLVLTSLSEAQPLVILEAGAAGIPTVATDIGACREMILGPPKESPHLGAGGAIVPLGNPAAVAEALFALLSNKDYYRSCSHAIRERVLRYYNKKDQRAAYAELYQSLLEDNLKATA